MATETIFVNVISGTTEVSFTDNQGNSGKHITTNVSRGDKVKWKVRTEGLVITGIPMKGTNSIWSEAPNSKGNGEWEGTISSSAPLGTEAYGLNYTINGNSYSQDPDLKVQD